MCLWRLCPTGPGRELPECFRLPLHGDLLGRGLHADHPHRVRKRCGLPIEPPLQHPHRDLPPTFRRRVCDEPRLWKRSALRARPMQGRERRQPDLRRGRCLRIGRDLSSDQVHPGLRVAPRAPEVRDRHELRRHLGSLQRGREELQRRRRLRLGRHLHLRAVRGALRPAGWPGLHRGVSVRQQHGSLRRNLELHPRQ